MLRNLAVVVLSAAAVIAQSSPAHAQAAGPFGVPCNSVGVNGTPYVPGVNCRLMAVDGYTRRFIVWAPPGGVPAGAPAVFMLHGASGNAELFLRISGWREKATQENFVAIFPTAVEHFVLETQRFTTRWNNYDLPTEIDPNRRPAGYPANSPWPADDVKFIRQIGGDVIQQLATDPHRVFVAGFSSGGGMCARLGVEASDLIAAVACHTSGLHQLHETLVGSRNLSAFFTIGTLDGVQRVTPQARCSPCGGGMTTISVLSRLPAIVIRGTTGGSIAPTRLRMTAMPAACRTSITRRKPIGAVGQ